MSRAQVWEGIYNFLIADQALLDLLGPLSPNNFGVFRSYPQFQAALSGYEPLDEGWLVIDEPEPGLRAVNQQIETDWEIIEPVFSVFATQFSLCDDISDRIDLNLHWQIEQQRDVQFGERIVLFTRRYKTKDSYEKEIKLYRKDITYIMHLVVTEQIP